MMTEPWNITQMRVLSIASVAITKSSQPIITIKPEMRSKPGTFFKIHGFVNEDERHDH